MITIIITIQMSMNVRRMSVYVLAMVQMLSASTLMGAMSAPVNKATEIIILSVKVSHKGILANSGGSPLIPLEQNYFPF